MENTKVIPGFITDVVRQCKINPQRIAIVDTKGCRNSSYGEFYDIVCRTIGYIKGQGIPQGSFIVINLPNCMEFIAVEFGAWLAGCAIAPVNPLYPKDRIDYIASHCESPLVVDDTILEEIKSSRPVEMCEPTADIAALYYTSGSTGAPKGVIHTFESLSRIDTFKEYGDARPDDCFAFGAPFSFIAGVLVIPFLRVGACLRLISRETTRDIRKLQAFYEENIATCAVINPPSTLKQLNLEGNKSLRMVLTGSERACNIKPQSNYKIFNLYGQTETSLTSLYFSIDKEYSNTPVGKPTSDLEMKIMDDGEICFRGALSPGYYKDPERSAALWSGGWFHTGDIGRMLPDGNVEYVNRKDWMVKINGQRVETGEISQVIKEVDGVRDAFAKGFTAEDGHQYIVAYYIADDSVKESGIMDYLSGKLAPYMIPSCFVRMKSFPVNANGKVDVKALQSPIDVQRELKREIVAPRNDNEKALCKAFESALGLSPVGIDDDFFSLGGDSIRVMQLQVACPQMDLSSTLIYRKRTVRAICEELECVEKVSMSPSASPEVCPLSKTQEGIYVESMARRGEIAYNNPVLYRFSDPIDAAKLAGACTEALKAHPNVLASIRIEDNGAAVQVKTHEAVPSVAVEQISDAEFEAVRMGLVQPFDLLSDPLYRIRIFKTESAVWLFTDFHHIIYDGTSNEVFLADVETAYEGGIVPTEEFTGFDLAWQEQSQRSTDFFEECRKWNLEAFKGPDRTSLPDPDRFSDKIAFNRFDVKTGISVHAFAKAAHEIGVTENVLATGAFGHILGACAHTGSSAFATVYNGRKSPKTTRTISMMVKTLPVYCRWDSKTLVGDYFNAVKDLLVGAMAHDLFSFAEICRETAYDSRVMFSYQDELLERNSLCGSACRMIPMQDNATGEPLTIQLYKDNGVLAVRAEYRSNMYSDEYVRTFVSCYETLLSGLLLCAKDSRMASLPLVSATQSDNLIEVGRGDELLFDKTETFVGMFRKQVAARPEAIAVVDENGKETYEELDRQSDALASMLVEEGVREDDFVALMLPRLRIFPLSYIACYKSGAAYVPLDYEYPFERIAYMIEDSKAKVLLTTRAILEKKTAEGLKTEAKVVFVDEIPENVKVEKGIDRSRPDGLAYMIYTSGTTGKPKGVMIEHHCLSNMVHWFAKECGIGPGVRTAEHASFSFDGSVGDLMSPLCFGGELHLLSQGLRKDLAALYRYYCENKIDASTMTTQLGMTLLRMYDLKLKCLMLGGEKLSGPFKTTVKLINGYGPTEFTMASSIYVVDTENTPDNIPIGRPVPNTLSAVVDSCGRLLPRGIAGELVLVGTQLSRGYFNRPEVTAERFVDCPFLPGEKMYRTGDLAKWNEDGQLLFLGRIDTQVKLRGFRIEIGEIESTLVKYPGIKAGVVAIKEIAGVQHLCAYYTSDTAIDKDSLKNHLAATLTDYMVPTAYIEMEALPMTPNGKVDLRQLPAPQIRAEEIVPPSTELETKLLSLAGESLGNSEFGVTTNLISMGLTSLGAITLSLLIERKAGLSLPSPKILEGPTVRQWADYLSDSSKGGEEGIKAYPKQDIYPLTDNQTGIYLDWEQRKDSIQYNVPMLFKFRGVAPEIVAEAVKSFVNAHPYLKTCLKSVDGETVQLRQDSLDVKVSIEALDSEPDKEWFQAKLKPFNLFETPLYRFSVFSYGESVWLLSDVHHIVFDGGSEALFAKDIADSCNGKEIKKEEFSAFDYSLYYKEWKDTEDFAKAGQYFESLLDGVVAATIPSTAEAKGEKGLGKRSISVPREPLRGICRSEGITENALMLTAVTEVLHRFSREDNIAMLTVSSGRSLRELERSCGMFVQTLPIVSHRSDRKIGESLKMMHDEIVNTLAYDKFPYTKIVEKTGLKAGIILAYQGDVLGGPLDVRGREVEMTGLSLDTAKLPLSINVMPGIDSTEIEFEYDKASYSDIDIELFAGAVKAFIVNMVEAGADAAITQIACVSGKETEELVEIGSGPEIMVEDGTIVGLFRKFALEHPDDPAVTDAKGTISYGELDKASDLLAGILLSKGLRKEGFVSLMLPRCKEFCLAYMAVYKSGGAYVPMDYEYPIERLQYMVDDSMSEFLITTHEIFDSKSKEGDIKVGNTIFIDELDFSKVSYSASVDNSAPQGLAYMIYTSGTTGKPKGVMIEHRAVMNMITWNAELERLGRGTHVAEHASFSFDASVINLMTPLSIGAHLFIIEEDARKDPEALYNYLCSNKIETICMSTQLGMMMLSSYKLPIRYIILGGEKLTGRYDRNITVVNGYGPTEFTICSSYHILDPDKESDNIPIGKAVPNTVSAIVDPCGKLLPKGVPGELVLIGPQIARGYFNKEEITRKRFVDCPFIPGQKMYHTGDLARWNEEGELMFMGRIDTQVKLRGFRIELGEIESRIASFASVSAAVAQVKEIGGVQHLCAYFTASEKIDTDSLKAHLSSSLTSYMVPDALMQLDEFPLTPNGKVDLKKLPLPKLSESRTEVFEEPQGDIETAIALAFQQALGIGAPLSRNASFFNSGGTSLLVMKVIVKLSEQGYELTYSDVFKYPTPQSLAAFIEGYRTGRGSVTVSEPVESEAVEESPSFEKGEDGYDYSAINSLLKTNCIGEIGNIKALDSNPVGDVLLLGSTGYLGIHILGNLLENSESKVYCVIRPKKGVTCAGRLKSYLMYYFDKTYSDLLDKRLFVIEGDMTDVSVMEKLLAVKVDTVINCAANVKHFVADDEIEKINLGGTEKLIEYCLRTGSRLIHTSTHSISGLTENGVAHTMLESELYFGQKMMTKYQTSKFAAERAILEACATKGLRAKIARLGNLMPRWSDGEFQINIENNGFMSRMRAYYLIGCIPSEHLHSVLEFAPIDATADAILTLARTPDKFTVFHPFNNHSIYIDDVISVMRQCGLEIKITDYGQFNAELDRCLKDDRLNPYITALLAYGSHNNFVVNQPSLDFTVNVLNAMDWRWPITGTRYLGDAFEKMISLEYFDK